MQALLITPGDQSVTLVQVDNTADIAQLIGYDTLTSDAIGDGGDRLFFDEECFLRGTTGRFQIDTLIPVSGKAVVLGADETGAVLSDVSLDASALTERIKFL